MAWNDELELATSFSRSEVLGRNFLGELVTYEDHDAVLELLNQAHDDKVDCHGFALTLYSKSAEPINLLLDVFPYFNEGRSVAGVSVIAKHASQQKQGATWEEMHFALNLEWEITAWNDALEDVSGFERYDVLGRNFGNFIVVDDHADFKEIMDETCQFHKCVNNFEFVLYTKSGMPIKLVVNATPYFNDGKFQSIAGASIYARHMQHDTRTTVDDHTVESSNLFLQGKLVSIDKEESSPSTATPSVATSLDELPELSMVY